MVVETAPRKDDRASFPVPFATPSTYSRHQLTTRMAHRLLRTAKKRLSHSFHTRRRPALLRKSGSVGNRTRALWICSQELWPLAHTWAQKFYTSFLQHHTVHGALCYKPESRGFDSRWGHWSFQLT
jgi:hypothetical protein